MNENFEYKIATKEDIDAIVQFLAKDYYETSRALKDPCKMIFLAYSGEVIIGILELLDLSNISFVYVSEDYQDTLVQEELLELAERFVTKELTAYTDEEHLSFFKQHDYSVDVESNGRYLLKKTIPVLPRFRDYDQVLAFIEAQKDRVYSLTNFKNFMYDFYDPQTKLTCVHIGGTNGKGSTTNYTKEVLKCAGYKVGTF
ncbi:MAG: folylpolyglutamate synthase/dihydrofolate synthase, partial [Catenibacterium sp.]